jgi:cellulose synthase/poly-beta-1,6-N-acetylglucosamine synthase-like glycosyltransferase
MKNKIPTVTIAVAAYNEEKNILNFLKSVLSQKEEGFVIKQIWVYSDGCDDKTAEKARSVKSVKVKVREFKKRQGKSTWLNDIYQKLDTDYLVQSDADVVFGHEFVVRDIILPMMKDDKIGMCGGNPMPVEGNTFWEKMVNAAFEPYQEFRTTVRRGSNIFSAIGQLLAFRNEVVKKIEVPVDMIVNDAFTYYSSLKMGWKYSFVKSAVVLFQSPKSLKDLVRQNTRFQAGYTRMFKYFPKELVEREARIPVILYWKTLIRQFYKYPVYSLVYFFVNKYAYINAMISGSFLNAKWPVAWSTKKLNKI